MKGFILIEFLIALLLFSIGLLGTTVMVGLTQKTLHKAEVNYREGIHSYCNVGDDKAS